MMTRSFIAILLGILIEIDLHATLAQRGSLWNDPLEEETASMAPPTFLDTPTVVTVKEGQLAKLECSLDNLGTKKVIWRRKSDLNPLTIGRRTYVDDERIVVDNQPLHPEWPLLIKQVRKDDAGDYECQVASKDKTIRRDIQLVVRRKKSKGRSRKKDRYKITDPTSVGGWDPSRELPPNFSPSRGINITGRTYVEKDHKLRLFCNATSIKSGHPLHDLDWFFNGQKLSTDVAKQMKIEKRVSLMDKTIHSVLEIAAADMDNAGVYICRTSALQITSARVDVLNGTKFSGTVNVKRSGTEGKDKTLNDGKRSSQRGNQNGGENGSRTNHPFSITTVLFCLFSSLLTTGQHKLIVHYLKWLPA